MKCYNCHRRLVAGVEACGDCDALTHPSAVAYFYVPPLRFLLLSLITGGLFIVYWFYKNWCAIKVSEQTDIRPFWRAIFNAYFSFGLFTRIYGDAKTYGYKGRSSASTPIISYIIANVLLQSFIRIADLDLPQLSSYLILLPLSGLLGAFTLLFFIQPAIKFHNAHHEHNASDLKNTTVTI